MERREVLILTCEQHRKYSDATADGLDRFWPEMPYQIILDTDRSTETPLPDNIRELARGNAPCLRRVFDFPYLTDADTMYVLDADILFYGHPHDFGPRAYQGVVGAIDDPAGIKVWKELGYEFEKTTPRFCAGMFSCAASLFRDNRELAIDYVQLCIKRGLGESKYAGIHCEQTFIAGLFRMTYPDNPLDPTRYPINHPCEGMVAWHISGNKSSPAFDEFVMEMDEWKHAKP